MPYVVVDTSVSLPATLSRDGLTRKFWIVLALGALTYEREHRELELTELLREAEQSAGRAGGLDGARARMMQAEERRAALLELLPYGVPDDWVAIGSAPVFDEYERKVREIGPRLDPSVREEDASLLRRQVEAVCVAGAPPFDATRVPGLTRDPKDDPIVYTALVGSADLLISDDKDIVPDGERQLYEHGEESVVAITFNTLMTDHLAAAEIDWSAIDGRWLSLFLGKYAGSFTKFTCVRAHHDGTSETLTLAPGSGAATGNVTQLFGPAVYLTLGGASWADIELTDGAGGGESFRLYSSIELDGGTGLLSGNLKGERGFGAFGVWGTARLTSCLDVVEGACKEDWHIVGALTIPDWREY